MITEFIGNSKSLFESEAKFFDKDLKFYEEVFKKLVKIKHKPYTPKSLSLPWNDSQQLVLNHFKTLPLESSSSTSGNENIFIWGQSGAGKTAVIQEVRKILHNNKVKCIFSTLCGVLAAKNNFSTFHSALGIRDCDKSWFQLYKNNYVTNNSRVLKNLRSVEYFFIDEISVIPASAIAYLDFLLRSVRSSDSPLVKFCFVGDYYQSRLVIGDKSLIEDTDCSKAELCFAQKGRDIFKSVHYKFTLLRSERHSQDSRFLELLHNVRRKNVSKEDISLLSSRIWGNLSNEEHETFKDSVLVCPRNFTVREYNTKSIKSFSGDRIIIKPVIKKNSRALHFNGQYDLELAVGCPVMLNFNYSVPNRIVNGLVGTLRTVLFKKGQPRLLMIKFENCNLPYLQNGCVPIPPKWMNIGLNSVGQPIRIKQFPISLYFATTIYKFQGSTSNKLKVFLDSKEFHSGATYTQLSRARKLSDITILDTTINIRRFLSPHFLKELKKEQEEAKRLEIYNLIYSEDVVNCEQWCS